MSLLGLTFELLIRLDVRRTLVAVHCCHPILVLACLTHPRELQRANLTKLADAGVRVTAL
jgi:hypothetical protein